MAIDELAPRSRRTILAAAAGAAGALAAGALIPASALAHDPDDVAKGLDNPTTATTSITNSAADSTALAGAATGTGSGFGLQGTTIGGGTNTAPGAAGVFGWSTSAPAWTPAFEASDTGLTGVFGYAPAGDGNVSFGSGVWGDSPDTGVFGSGGTGVEGVGYWGVLGHANSNAGSVGVYAYAGATTSTALYVSGKAHFSRSGHTAIAAGRSSLTVYLTGVTSASKVFAVLGTSASGRYIRAVVPTTGRFTVYLNTTLAAKAYVNWFVLD